MFRSAIVCFALLVGVSEVIAEDQSRPIAITAPSGACDHETIAYQWLQAAIDVSLELSLKDEEPDTEALKRSASTMGSIDAFRNGEKVERVPRESHGAKYLEIRPWSLYHAPWQFRTRSTSVPTHPERFPFAYQLRDLLNCSDPKIRAMAAEAIATMHEPEDVPRLAQLLEVDAPASPFLGYNMQFSATPDIALISQKLADSLMPNPDGTVDRLDLSRSWRAETVHQCARRSLMIMTGMRFDTKADFEKWWKVNSDGRNCLWYWQQRLERDLREADISASSLLFYKRPSENSMQLERRQQALQEAARDYARSVIADELRQLDPEVEAKVRMLAFSDYGGGLPIRGDGLQFWLDAPNLRVSSDRLLDILDRKVQWRDVSWEDRSHCLYTIFAERLGMWSRELLRPSDVPRLKAALERERVNLGWSGEAGLIIGISRLLPAASDDDLDDQTTRDGFLRAAIVNERDLFVRSYCARELVRVGLPANSELLASVTFAARDDDELNEVGQNVLQELMKPPLTPSMRQFLVELLLDQRFETFWTRPNSHMGMDMCRQYGIWAVNKHAGKEVIGNSIENRLTDPNESAHALEELRNIVRELGKSE